MRVTLDTNVLLSAALWYGDSSRILDLVENKEIELILSDEIINELSRVFEYEEIKDKIQDKKLEMLRTVERIREISVIVEPAKIINAVKDDPDDNKIIECALEGKADYIISKDNHLLNLKEYEGIEILSPKDFLEIMKNQ